ncbi:hypothetical protein LUZ63_017824 [Rhynchospora breviuscula]|uniref:Reverse transcriptase zinc-binding domain-containing protein n=1 Tax=Rhynchospora breviuscula TaxID=2022672 RepID=A0A9Q0C384_9POAL|nr:hypothetical protein LUZ63_017824 [Rhynchospora breviuscula]
MTDKRPDRFAFQQLIDKVALRLSGWKRGLISRAGRIVLASSVLSMIPIFFMSIFKLPSWVITQIDRIRRNFIWKGGMTNGSGLHLLSWDRVCLPKQCGGLGLLNIKLHNISLLLRWLWRLPPPSRNISLLHAIPRRHELVPAPWSLEDDSWFQAAQNIPLSPGIDKLVWRWTTNGKFSVASTYKQLILAGKHSFQFVNFWKLKVPPTVKLFLVLLCHGRILTQEQLLRRNINVDPQCHLCGQLVLETSNHLFVHCVFSSSLWSMLQLPGLEDLQSLFELLNALPTNVRNSTLIATAISGLWLERNSRIFRDQRRNMQAVHDWMVHEATLFMKSC